MELWVRSQDGTTLLKANKLVIEEDGYACHRYYFIKNYTGDIGTILGSYKSLTRALEVLDEIQEHIQHNCIDRDFVATIYEMPENAKKINVFI